MTKQRKLDSILRPRNLLLAGFLLLFIWLAVKAVRIGQAAVSLQAREAELRPLLAGDLRSIDPALAGSLLLDVRRDVVVIYRETRPFFPLLPALGWVPRFGPLLVSAPALLEMADAGTAAAVYAYRGLEPALPQLQAAEGQEGLPAVLRAIADAGPDLAQAHRELERANAALAEIEDPDALPWRVQQLLEPVATYLPMGIEGLAVAEVLPSLAGLDEPKNYLFLAQNEDELRPTGGFISGAGLLRVEAGRIVELTFLDANRVDDWQSKPYEFPPDVGAAPLYDLMASELFLFRDGNFWPDFPMSAEALMALYTYGQGVQLDGVIGTDQDFLRMLVTAVGPVFVDELATEVTADNVMSVIRAAWSPPEDSSSGFGEWILTRKSFMGPLASALKDRLERAPGQIDLLRFAQLMHEALETKHLLLYMADPATGGVLNELGWDGSVAGVPGQDLLLVVDTNVGFNKVNALVRNDFDYRVSLTEQGTGEAALAINYTHPGEPDSA
jgi:hypothetical protein